MAGIPFRVPPADLLPERLSVLPAVIYFIFNERYVATSGDRLTRQDLCKEAIRHHAARADLLRRRDQREAAADAYERAINLCSHSAERAYLQRRHEMLNLIG